MKLIHVTFGNLYDFLAETPSTSRTQDLPLFLITVFVSRLITEGVISSPLPHYTSRGEARKDTSLYSTAVFL